MYIYFINNIIEFNCYRIQNLYEIKLGWIVYVKSVNCFNLVYIIIVIKFFFYNWIELIKGVKINYVFNYLL